MKKLAVLVLPLIMLAGCQSMTPDQPATSAPPHMENQILYCTPEMAHYKGKKDARRGRTFDQSYGSNCANQRDIDKLRAAYKSGYDAK